jgi:hypothetical protein
MASVEARLRLAGLLIAVGLLVELATLRYLRPIAFFAFALIALPLVLVGCLIYLWALVHRESGIGPTAAHRRTPAAGAGRSR